MPTPDVLATSASAVALVLSALCFLFAIRQIVATRHVDDARCKSDNDISYEDVDGIASDAAVAEFSDWFPRSIIVICSLGTLVASTVQIVIAKVTNGDAIKVESWIFIAGWSLVVVQSLILIRERSPICRFDIGLLTSLQSAALTIGVAYCSFLREKTSEPQVTAVEIVLGLLVALAALSLPRRPTVSRDGKPVDAQFTTSALQRYTLEWIRPLLDQARKQGTLEYKDLPILDIASTTKKLYQRFRRAQTPEAQTRALWYVLYLANRRKHIRQWCVAVSQCLVTFLPQYCLLRILQRLEDRERYRAGADLELWMLLAALAASKTAFLAFEVWVSWISHCMLKVESRAQLSAMVFEKVMHMKDIKQIRIKSVSTDNGLLSGIEPDEVICNDPTKPLLFDQRKEGDDTTAPSTVKGDDSSKANEADGPQTSQGFINLLAVDVTRVSSFVDNHFYGLQAILQLILGVIFLIQLIGPWSTVSGLGVVVFFQPFSTLMNNYYSKAELEVMNARDEKSHIVTEALHGIRQIKFSAIEGRWQALIMRVRQRELSAQRRSYLWGTVLVTSWMTMPIIFGTVALGVYAALNHGVDASVAFTALAVFGSMESALFAAPSFITGLLDARISLNRLQQHLDEPDQEDTRIAGDAVTFENVTIAWPSDRTQSNSTFELRDVSLDFPKGELSVIHGKTGSGKSLLLSAIIGEADILKGILTAPYSRTTVNLECNLETDESNWVLPHSMAFVAQIPWIENATIKANILYGLPLNASRYSRVLRASALKKDLDMLTDGDETEVGATGINLSGGQKWRLTFARALYSRAGTLVLDDIFSAVDAHVGRHIFEDALCGELCNGRTRILVTHHVDLVLQKTSYLVEIGAAGHVSGMDQHELNSRDVLERVKSMSKESVENEKIRKESISDEGGREIGENAAAASKFVEDEKREQGVVKWNIYRNYIKASGGYSLWSFIVALFALATVVVVARSYWVKIWSQEPSSKASPSLSSARTLSRKRLQEPSVDFVNDNTPFYLGIYFGISVATVLFAGIKSLMVVVASLRASRKLFQDMTFSILRAPLRWLDTVPTGRILNRFVGDFELIDTRLGGGFVWFASYLFTIIGIVVAGLFISAWILLPVVVLTMACTLVAKGYFSGARALKRLESNAKSPIYELLGSSLSGLATIRSFGKRDEYLERMYDLIDQHTQTTWYSELAIEWMEVRQGLLGILYTTSVACVILALNDIDAALAGFALSFALQSEVSIVHSIFFYAGFELSMNAVERVDEYINMPIEEVSGVEIPHVWPSEGHVVVESLETGYAAHLPSVLKDISFTVQARERVGVVGRTGSGKSSLTLAIFRFLEARSGSISIDGIDISTIKLEDLRSRLAIIPQDPVLFSGTIRSNIDPFDEHSDMAIYEALRRVHLLDSQQQSSESGSSTPSGRKSQNIFRNLSHPISRGGLNLSQGQRQLLCLARALISKPKVLVLDEATSSVDMATDALIQRSIREEFSNCTLLVIAHRLSTITDFDKVLVLGSGRVLEFGTPKELWKEKGAFWDMVRESGQKDVIERDLKG